MLFILIMLNLAILVLLGLLALFWLSGSALVLKERWQKLREEHAERHLLAGPTEVKWLMAALLVLTLALWGLQMFRHFPGMADIQRRTRAERVAGMRDYRLVRMQLDERPWYNEAITGKGSILDRTANDSLALARYHFDERDSMFARYYPLGDGSIHLIGYSTRVRGRSGLESAFHDYMVGESALTDRLLNTMFRVQKKGSNLRLTIDYELQKVTSAALKENLRRQGTTRGAACVMDPRTGEILALVSLPSYTLDVVESGMAWMILNHDVRPIGEDSVAIVNPAREDTLYTLARADYPEDTPVGHAIKYSEDRPLFFRTVRGIYPPGSTFKVVMSALLFEEGMEDYEYHSDGRGYVPEGFRRPIRNHGPQRDIGYIDVYKALEISDNTFFVSLADSVGPELVREYAEKMGVIGPMEWNSRDDRLNQFRSMEISDIPYEPRDRYDLALSGMGQGPLVTNPLRMAVAISTIANGGKRCQPTIEYGLDPVCEQVLDDDTCEEVTEAMIGVVEGEEGTARGIQMPNLRVAAKTGTAQSPGDRRDHSWFVCFAPADQPKLVVAVMGENAGWGSVVGLRTARAVLERAKDLGYVERDPSLLERLFGMDSDEEEE